MRRILVGLFVILSLASSIATANAPVRVVTSFSVLADWVEQVGGEHVNVSSLVGNDEDVHVYKPTPKDMGDLSKANLLIINGLGLEGWMNRIIEASNFSGALLVASEGIEVLVMDEEHDHDHSDHHKHDHDKHDHDKHGHDKHVGEGSDKAAIDPHAWTSLTQAAVYVSNIRDQLVSLKPEYKDYFAARAASYIEQLNDLDHYAEHALESVPASKRNIVIPHNAFAYLARDYDLDVHSISGLSTKADVSAHQVATIVRIIRKDGITAIFNENIANTKLIEQVRNETGVVVSGTLISGALSDQIAPTYIDMMKYNLKLMTEALTQP